MIAKINQVTLLLSIYLVDLWLKNIKTKIEIIPILLRLILKSIDSIHLNIWFSRKTQNNLLLPDKIVVTIVIPGVIHEVIKVIVIGLFYHNSFYAPYYRNRKTNRRDKKDNQIPNKVVNRKIRGRIKVKQSFFATYETYFTIVLNNYLWKKIYFFSSFLLNL